MSPHPADTSHTITKRVRYSCSGTEGKIYTHTPQILLENIDEQQPKTKNNRKVVCSRSYLYESYAAGSTASCSTGSVISESPPPAHPTNREPHSTVSCSSSRCHQQTGSARQVWPWPGGVTGHSVTVPDTRACPTPSFVFRCLLEHVCLRFRFRKLATAALALGIYGYGGGADDTAKTLAVTVETQAGEPLPLGAVLENKRAENKTSPAKGRFSFSTAGHA